MLGQILLLIIPMASLGILLRIVREFTKRKLYMVMVSFPFALFTVGFSMRLSKIQDMIDIGYFLTDMSFLFVYSIFSLSFILGQIKYWKKS
ncbi:MAG: hypothetical protein HYW25_02200 [Candidatus Aenigmarchaeota archaeon]|nr:hypothetical protein [Candidatus Aenigmarchaeota archaeon]